MSGCLYNLYVALELMMLEAQILKQMIEADINLVCYSCHRLEWDKPKKGILSSSGLFSDFISCQMNSCWFLRYIKARTWQVLTTKNTCRTATFATHMKHRGFIYKYSSKCNTEMNIINKR